MFKVLLTNAAIIGASGRHRQSGALTEARLETTLSTTPTGDSLLLVSVVIHDTVPLYPKQCPLLFRLVDFL